MVHAHTGCAAVHMSCSSAFLELRLKDQAIAVTLTHGLRGTVHGFQMQTSPNQHFFLLPSKTEHKWDVSKCHASSASRAVSDLQGADKPRPWMVESKAQTMDGGEPAGWLWPQAQTQEMGKHKNMCLS